MANHHREIVTRLETEFLTHAEEYNRRTGLDKVFVVDVDAHHLESLVQLVPYADPLYRHYMVNPEGKPYVLPSNVGDRRVGQRIKRPRQFANDSNVTAETAVREFVEDMDSLGIDASVVFPTDMLSLGLHPQLEIEVAVAEAYARWMADEILRRSKRIKSMLYLPFGDPDTCLRIVDQYSDIEGVVGFMITSVRYQPVHDNRYMDLYAEIEKKGLPLGFHPLTNWEERVFYQLNRFISVHALGFPFYNMLNLTNWVINGLPERFPRLRTVWIEGGLSYVPFIMSRLDSEYIMRTSEAPLLTKLPSEYMRQMYFTTQPFDVEDEEFVDYVVPKIGASQILYSSDYPHWDFDLPRRLWEIPRLDDRAKLNILGLNAAELFGLDPIEKNIKG